MSHNLCTVRECVAGCETHDQSQTATTDPYVCQRCNHDTHTCPGCGAKLSHGVEVCGRCPR